MASNNGYGVQLGFQFTSFDVVNKEFQNMIKRLSDVGKVDLQFNIDGAKINDSVNKIKEQLSNLGVNTSGFDNVINQQIKTFSSGASQQILTLKNSANEVLKIIQNLNNQGEVTSTTGSVSSKANVEAQVNLYKQLASLNSNEFALKKQLLNADELQTSELNKQLELNKQMQQITGRAISGNLLSDEKLNNDLIQKRIDLQNKYNLSASQVMDNVQTKLESIQNTISKLKDNGLYKNSFTSSLQNELNGLNTNTPIEKINNLQEKVKALGSSESSINTLQKSFSSLTSQLEALESKYKGLVPTSELNSFKDNLKQLQTSLTSVQNGNIIDGNKISSQIGIARQSFTQLTNATKENSVAIKTGNQDVMSFGEGMKNMLGHLSMYFGAYQIISLMTNAIKQGLQTVLDMDTAMADLNKVVSLSNESLQSMTQSAIQMGQEFGRSVTEVAQAQAEFGKLYKTTAEINELTQASLLGANVMDNSTPAQVSKSLTTIMTAMKMNASDSMTILDSMNEIQNNYRVSADTLSASLGQVSSTAYASGVSLQKTEGYITAIAQATGKVTIY